MGDEVYYLRLIVQSASLARKLRGEKRTFIDNGGYSHRHWGSMITGKESLDSRARNRHYRRVALYNKLFGEELYTPKTN